MLSSYIVAIFVLWLVLRFFIDSEHDKALLSCALIVGLAILLGSNLIAIHS